MATQKDSASPENREVRLRVRAREFCFPPVRDALIIGRRSPVGCVAMKRALALISPNSFEAIEIPDHPTVSDLLVRQHLLLRVSRDRLIQFVLQRIAPLMAETECLHLELEVEVEMEAGL
jgi:hypothetical protein